MNKNSRLFVFMSNRLFFVLYNHTTRKDDMKSVKLNELEEEYIHENL